MKPPPPLFDRALHRRRLDRAARGFHAADFLKRRAAEDIAERLGAIRRRFGLALDLGARDGAFGRALAAGGGLGGIDLLIEADLSAAMLAPRGGARIVLDEERLPIAPARLDLVVSSLALHWTNDLVGTLIQVRRALAPDGLFIGAMFGGATLTELRRALLEAEADLTGGAGPRISPFLDAGDAAHLLQRAGFALPVADVDTVTVRYGQPLELLADLRAMGETSALIDRPRAPLGRAVLARACDIYRARFAGPDGRLVATFEIITLTGWAPHPGQPKPLRRGSARMRLADALGTIEHSAGDKAGGAG